MLRVLLVGLVFCGRLCSADEPPAYKLAAPAGWGGESIRLPPQFAPDMTLQGAEHIRFAPGMMKPASDSFFSYAFAFELQPQPRLSPSVLQAEFLKYYRGLCKSVLNGRVPDVDTSKFTLELKQEPPSEKLPADEGEGATTRYRGALDWLEPFATKKPQTLNLEIWTWSKNDRNYLFASVSPQAFDSPIWRQLRTIRDDYRRSSRQP